MSEELGFSIGSTIVTNGSLINPSVMKFLLRINCNLIQITIDGAKSQHDQTRIFKTGVPSFDLLIEKIKFVASYVAENQNLRLLVRFNLNNTSIKDVEKHFLYLNRILESIYRFCSDLYTKLKNITKATTIIMTNSIILMS